MPSTPPETPRGKKHRLLLRVERFSRERYLVVFLAAALALVGGSWLGSRLDLESDILALIPAGNRKVDTLKEALIDFGSIDYLLVLLDAREGAGADELEDFADLLAERLEQREDLVEFVEYRFQLDDDLLHLLYGNAVLFLPPERLPELRERLSDAAIRERLARIKLQQATPTAPFLLEVAVNDPLDLTPLFLNRLEGNRGVFRIDVSDGYYLSSDGRTLIMIVKPTGPSQDMSFDRRLLDAVRATEADVRAELGEEAAVDVRYGGNYAIAVDEAKLIRQDVRFNIVFSLLAVSALYWLCYRRFAALLYSSLPLLVGQALTFALCYVVLHQLNASSAAFTALLMGLGTDFVIVVYARYVEERQRGLSLTQATEVMIGETGLGVFTGAITSAGTFYAMCTSQFRGLRDLGFLIGSGILLCAIAILCMLPAMIKWNEGVRRRKVDSVTKLHLQSFGLERLIPFSARHRRLVLGLLAVLTALGAWAATELEFDDTINVLRSNNSPALRVQDEINDRFGASLSYMMAIAEGETQDEAIALTAKIAERLAPFRRDGVVGSVNSLETYLPPTHEQDAVLSALRADTTGAFDPERVRTTFVAALNEQGLRPEAFAPFLERLDPLLRPERPIELSDLEQQGLGRVLDRYVARRDGRVRIVTYMFLSDPRWKREAPPGLVEALTHGEPKISVTGTNVVGQEFRRIFSHEAPRAVMIGLLVVFALLWIDFRSLRLTSIALAQLLCGVTIMLGLMKAADIHLNYVNAFVATMILGVGIDYSIHLVHRLSLTGGRVSEGLLETGKAVVVAALTNIAGFGTLALGNYPALRSFGIVALFGSISCLFTALTLVPALMALDAPPEEPPA